jgi:hypothetical protein
MSSARRTLFAIAMSLVATGCATAGDKANVQLSQEIRERAPGNPMQLVKPETTQELPWCATEHQTTPLCREPRTVGDYLLRQTQQQKQRTDLIVKLTPPLFNCVKKNIPKLLSSPETADVVARAAVGLCAKEEQTYRAALFQLSLVITSFDAEAKAKNTHEQLVDFALTMVVGARQLPQAPSSRPTLPNPPTSSGI